MAAVGFSNVEEMFAFLRPLGFTQGESGPARVGFESARVGVWLLYDAARGGETDLVLSFKPLEEQSHPAFSLAELGRLLGLDFRDQLPVNAVSQMALDRWVKTAADLLRSHGKAWLSGEESLFDRLLECRSREADDLARRVALRDMRSAATEAWQRKDYRAVVELFEPFAPALTESEARKLKIARQRVATDTPSR